ncbi:LGFP repeat-containing protein, partial [Modestobacter sp. SYSU DS0511]
MPLGDVAATADGKAQAGQFQGGWLYVHESLGARVVPVAVRNGWEAAGGVLGSLGYPTSDVVAVAGGRGSVMPFQGGAVFVSAATGGHGVPAALLTAYETAGGPEGLLGFPTAAAGRTPDGKARFQHFQGGS